jgi:uncharacterized protein (TIGR03086 family)
MRSQQDTATTRQLSESFASTRAVLARVRRDQLQRPTPCASWDVAALISHFVGTARWAAAAVSGTDQDSGDDYAAGDFLASYDESIKAAMTAFEADGVLDTTVQLPFGQFSGAAVMSIAISDQFVHGWDLARATGYDAGLDQRLAGLLLVRARREVPDAYRGPDGMAPFGPEAQAPAAADPADRLAAFLGRPV